MIELRELTKSFDGFKVLNGLNLNVPKGAVYGLVGSNGAGKSTAIRHMVGIYRQDSGEVLMDGRPLYENPELKSRISYIPDDIFYFPQASIWEMKEFYRKIYPEFDFQRYKELGEIFNIDDRRSMRKLSKGMQKQAAFRIAISLRPDVVIMDEPMDGLDPVMRRQVWSVLLSDVAERGTTVLVSSHNLRELEDVCDHVGIMNHGKMIVERGLSELQESLVKIQLALPEGEKLPQGLDIIHQNTTGRLQQLILRGSAEEITQRLSAAHPLFTDVLPLTLEEIFIYELGGAESEVKNAII